LRSRRAWPVAAGVMDAKEGEFDRFAPENPAAVAVWLASPAAAGISGQVGKGPGGVAQLLRGWRPLTEATSDAAWTIESLSAARDALVGGNDTGVPPF